MIVVGALGCTPKHLPAPATADPLELLARSLAEAPTTPRAAAFSVRIDTPDHHVAAAGTVVVAPPDRFRIDLRGPIGPPQLVVGSDGTSLWVWQAPNNIFSQAAHADHDLGQAVGLGLEAVASLLSGRVPADLGAPVAEDTTLTWERGGARVQARLDPRTAELAWFEARDASDQVWVEMRAEGDDRTWTLPIQGVEVQLALGRWAEVAPDPSVFAPTVPAGADVREIPLGSLPTAE